MRSSKPGQANVQEGCARTAASRFSERTNSDQATAQNPSLKYQASCAKSPSIIGTRHEAGCQGIAERSPITPPAGAEDSSSGIGIIEITFNCHRQESSNENSVFGSRTGKSEFKCTGTSIQACFAEFQTRDPSHIVPSIEQRIRIIQARNFTPSSPTTTTALTNVRIFSGHDIQSPRTVFITNGLISFSPTPNPSATTIIDGQNGILLPGFIDSHVHPTSLTDLEALSSYGVTTAMSMSCLNYTLCSSLLNLPGLTTFITAGFPAMAPNTSHALLFNTPLNELITSPTQAPLFVSEVFNNGSSYLKLISEPNGLSQETQTAIVAATHARGKQAMTHAVDFLSYSKAILSKTNGLQHIVFDTALTPELIATIKAQQQHVTPTLNIAHTLFQNPQVPFGGAPPNYTAASASVLALHNAGVPILVGTDSVTNIPFIKPIPMGVTLHWEMENLVAAGMSTVEVLRAATVEAARWHGLRDRGRVEEGYRADLVLLMPGSDPIGNISETRRIARVWNGGVEFGAVASGEGLGNPKLPGGDS
ncbi:hypothetical protein G7Y89_g11722 [Cudoniella acicularis]|uniref:Amidohydrolase-related domain-containing protein n=1 Tax=Cudoniella acicularis TaxID=354080 RepID=A0A8H4RCY3_9HELO|nr:hypothetical protein G7Y89_g11722 [Cudoniella acicularis]